MWCWIYLLIMLVSGYPIAAGLARRSTRLETAALTLCVGPGAAGFCLLMLSMVGMRPGRGEILILGAAMLAATIVVSMCRGRSDDLRSVERTPRWWARICLFAIGYGLVSVAINVTCYPVLEWDAFAIWQLKAKVLALYPLHPRPDYFSNVSLSYSHLRYPLLGPMMSAGMLAVTQQIDDYGKWVSLLLYPGMLLVVFVAVKRLNGATAGFGAAALVAVIRPVLHYGGTGTAEMAETTFYAGSILCILRWRETRAWGFVVLAAILSALAAWTKNEGLALSLVNVIVIAARGPRGRRGGALAAAAVFAGIVFLIYLPWIAFSWGLPRTDEDYAGRLTSSELIHHFGRLKTIAKWMVLEFINWWDWGFFWIIVLVMAVAERRRFREPMLATIGALLALHILAYVPPLMVTNWKLQELLAVTLDRLFMHAAPVGAILVGALWPHWAGGTNQRPAPAPSCR